MKKEIVVDSTTISVMIMNQWMSTSFKESIYFTKIMELTLPKVNIKEETIREEKILILKDVVLDQRHLDLHFPT